MNCAALAWETRADRALTAEEQTHVQGCAACQAEQALMGSLRADGPGPSKSLNEKILAAARAELAVRPVPTRWSRVWLAGSVVALLASAAALPIFHLRTDISGLELGLDLALLAAAFVLAGRAAFGPGLVPRGRVLAAVAVALAATSLMLCPGLVTALR